MIWVILIWPEEESSSDLEEVSDMVVGLELAGVWPELGKQTDSAHNLSKCAFLVKIVCCALCHGIMNALCNNAHFHIFLLPNAPLYVRALIISPFVSSAR